MSIEEKKEGTDSLWVEKTSKGYNYGAKVYVGTVVDDDPDKAQKRLNSYIDKLKKEYDKEPQVQ